MLGKLNSEISELNANLDEKQTKLNILTEEATRMQNNLNAAKKLLAGLGREQKRWTEDTELLNISQVKLLGDCLLSSSFLSYVGPFDFSFRKQMLYDNWYVDI